jgi:hypothetical protein
VKRFGTYGRKISWLVKSFGKRGKKSELNSEMKWKIRKNIFSNIFHFSTCLSAIFSISFHNFLLYFPYLLTIFCHIFLIISHFNLLFFHNFYIISLSILPFFCIFLLNSEKTWKIWKKSKWNVKWYGKYGRNTSWIVKFSVSFNYFLPYFPYYFTFQLTFLP